MKNRILFLGFLLLLAGCIDISIDQKVERDGSSLITEKIDMSAIVSIMESYQKTLSTPVLAYDEVNIAPDNTFKESNYAFSDASSKGLLVEVVNYYGDQIDTEFEANDEFSSLSLDIFNTNEYTVKRVAISIKSKAFIAENVRELSNIEPEESIVHYVQFKTANVSAGSYPVIFLITFYDDKNQKQTVTYKTTLKVKEKEELPVQQPKNALFDFSSTMEEVCKNATKKDPELECTYSAGIFTVSKKMNAEEAEYEFKKESKFPNIVYTLKVTRLPEVSKESPDLGSTSGLPGGSAGMPGGGLQTTLPFTNPLAKTTAASFKLMNAKMSYKIEMPGEITAAKNGKIEDGKAVYDVIELMDKGLEIEVESKELDVTMVAIAGAGILGVLVVAILVLVLRKPAPPATKHSK